MSHETRQRRTIPTAQRGWIVRPAVLLSFLLAATLAFGQQQFRSAREGNEAASRPKMAPELATMIAQARQLGKLQQRMDVIVQFKQTPTRAQMQALTSQGGAARSFSLIHAAAAALPGSLIEAFAARPDVVYISPNRSLRGAADFAETTVGADVAQSYGYDGSGIAVAVIDSGIADHPDLHDPVSGKSRVVYSQTFVPNTNTSDPYGHGTHVAGIIAGNAQASGGMNNPKRIYGVAPNVNLVNLKVLDQNGVGKDSYVIAALQQAIVLKNTYNIRVVNLSLGRPVYESYSQDPLDQAVESEEYLEWVGLLKSCAAFEAYCKAYTAELRPLRVAEFLLLNSDFPHSVRFSVDRVHGALTAIGELTDRRADQPVRLAGKLRAALSFSQIDEILAFGAGAYVDDIRWQCGNAHSAIHQVYFDYNVESALAS